LSAQDGAVTLREITAENVRAVCDLELARGQERYVAPTSVSIAEANYEPRAWLRAIYAGEDPAGLVLLHLDEDKPEYHLWRLMIAAGRQGQGIGRRAMDQVVEHVRGLPGATELLTSYVPGEQSPAGFYEALGFDDTGRIEEGERVLSLRLRI
jgi:diamine N-acetyltransferase